MGLHLIRMFCLSGHLLIAFQILQQLDMAQFGMLLIFFPQTVRQLLADSNVLVQQMLYNTQPNVDVTLNLERIKWCIANPSSSRSLFDEYQSIQPFHFASTLDTLHFTSIHSIKTAVFNPQRPVLALITVKNVLYIYYWPKQAIVFYKLMHDASFITLSWSPNGTYLYIIEYNYYPTHCYVLTLYKLSSSCKSLRQIFTGPIKGSLNTKYLWLSDNELLYSTPKNRTQTNLIKLHIGQSKCNSGSSVITKTFFYSNASDVAPCNFECLARFNYISNVTYLLDRQALYFTTVCTFSKTCCHAMIVEVDVATKKIVRYILVPSRIVAFEANSSLLVFGYVVRHLQYAHVVEADQVSSASPCPIFGDNEDNDIDPDPMLVMTVVDGSQLRYLIMDDR